ncbi:long-chain-fatty-acid--CoA ligase [Derxia gummosa]|uniref:Long-chain-fatty-acid--CoA ligase n=1 Tax=Derxia gummosa DSM 723 TaxID=1121388 RepID=A0A9U5GGB3_9BURK|nr:long-chain-fatty-acid--CoA ligase [Derxia gummosa]
MNATTALMPHGRPWLEHYPPGMPVEVDAGQTASLVELFEDAVRRFNARPAYWFMERQYSFQDVDVAARHFAAWLQSLGLARGARVAVMLPNLPQFPVALFGILRAGYTVVNVNPLYTPRELEYQLKDSGAEAIVILENFAHTLEQVIARTALRHVAVTAVGDMLGALKGGVVNLVLRRVKKVVPAWKLPGHVRFMRALAIGERLPFARAKVGRDDIAFLQYTGGTTGVAKGAVITHANMLANVLQSAAWYEPALRRIPVGEQVRQLGALPLYHIFALNTVCLLGMCVGAEVLLIPNARDFGALLGALKKHPVHVFPAVNTLFNALMDHPAFGGIDWSKLKLSVGGGMAVQSGVAARWLEKTGCSIVEGYGLSETSPVVCCNPTTASGWNGSIGMPLPGTDISIRNDDGNPVAIGVPGELCVKGPQVMRGYWNRPDETRKVMTPDGYLMTGDIAVLDERGFVKIVDRKKDMILVSGFNVYPNEVEDVLGACPGVKEVAAIGVPDQHSGEAVRVYVVRRDGSLDEATLRAWAKDNLTGYKRPKEIVFRDELPKTPVGKILRRVLRDEAKG